MDYLDRITLEPSTRSGEPRIRGLGITVDDVLNHLGAGRGIDGVLKDFPELEREDVLAAMQYAAVLKVIRKDARRLKIKTSFLYAAFFVLVLVLASASSPYEPQWLRIPAIYIAVVALTYAGISLVEWLSKAFEQN